MIMHRGYLLTPWVSVQVEEGWCAAGRSAIRPFTCAPCTGTSTSPRTGATSAGCGVCVFRPSLELLIFLTL